MSYCPSRDLNRAHPSRGFAAIASLESGATLLLAAALSGCVSYRALPMEPLEILQELDAVQWEGSPASSSAEASGSSASAPGPAQLAAFAVHHNPDLKAARSKVGVSRALLVEAGLLPDPEIGWDGMDVLASQIVDSTSSRVDFLSGFGLSISLPRPGELSARKGAAAWRVEAAKREVTQKEWMLAREVFLAYEDLRGASEQSLQNEDLSRVVKDTDDYFQRAMQAGVATAIESSLAHGDLLSIRAQSLRLDAVRREAKQKLNWLLGLPPTSALEIQLGAERNVQLSLPESPELFIQQALERRPDLARLLAEYQASEDEVRLEVARQYPQISIGTGLWLIPGFLSRFNRPAIMTAMARRESLGQEVQAAVHEVRRDIHDLWSELEEARVELRFLETELLPNAEESLRLAGNAFQAGEATLVQILNVQRALVDARTSLVGAQAELARRTWQLYAAGGTALFSMGDASTQTKAQNE